MYWESCSSPNFETTVSQLGEVPAYRLRLRSTSVAPSRDLGHTVQQRSASGLEGGPFRAVLLNLGLLERRQIPEGEARGLRSGLLRRAAAVGRRAKTPLEFPVSEVSRDAVLAAAEAVGSDAGSEIEETDEKTVPHLYI